MLKRGVMKKFLLILGLFLSVCGSVRADSYEYSYKQCKDVMQNNPPKINIIYNYGNLEYDTSKNQDELLQMFAEVEPGKEAHNINGLTALSPHISMKTSVKYDNLDSGRYCFYPQNVEVKLWYEPKVYILNSLEPGSCRFNVTVRHEQTHLDLGHLALYVFALQVQDKLPQIINEVGPRVEADNNKSENLSVIAQYLNQDYHKQLEKLFLQFKDNLDEQNAIIDSIENYQQETMLCP